MTCKQPVVVVLVGVFRRCSVPDASPFCLFQDLNSLSADLGEMPSYNEFYLIAVIAGLMRLDEGGEEN